MPKIETEPHSLSWKRVYDQPTPRDGMRVLIDRLWPRGVHKQDLTLNGWWKDLAPRTELRKWFGHDPARWDEFRLRYAAGFAARPHLLEAIQCRSSDRKFSAKYQNLTLARCRHRRLSFPLTLSTQSRKREVLKCRR
jgi:uncharacterized protein YeaO (DUF488 family)